MTGQHFEQQCRVGDRRREGADLVEGAGEGDEAVPRDETVGRLDTDDAAEGGRLTNRTTGVRAE